MYSSLDPSKNGVKVVTKLVYQTVARSAVILPIWTNSIPKIMKNPTVAELAMLKSMGRNWKNIKICVGGGAAKILNLSQKRKSNVFVIIPPG